MTLSAPADSPAMVDGLRISAECRNVALHPTERLDLIEQAISSQKCCRGIRSSAAECAR